MGVASCKSVTSRSKPPLPSRVFGWSHGQKAVDSCRIAAANNQDLFGHERVERMLGSLLAPPTVMREGHEDIGLRAVR